MRKIYNVGGSNDYANWMEGIMVSKIEDADLVLFTGGEDVFPLLYNEVNVHPFTQYNKMRDIKEQKMFDKALELNIPMIGICRGSQFLCVMNGGKLVQHQQNRLFNHNIFLKEGGEIIITSTHHQAQFPFNLPKEEYDILGWTENLSEMHENGLGEELNPPVECEIVYYPKTRCLGIQGHPEYMDLNSETIKYLRKMLDKFLINKL
jgi:putative glutamine amidotransferase